MQILRRTRRHTLWLALPALALIFGIITLLRPIPGSAVGDCTIDAGEAALDNSEQDLLAQINAYRRANGVPDLTASPTLNKAAAWLARDMAQRRVMSHIDSLGRGLDRLADCGYRYYPAGENVAYGSGSFGDPGSVLRSWKGSPGHNANMLNSSYRAAGVGRACAGNACFWALDLGGVVDGTAPGSPSTPTQTTSTRILTTPTVTSPTTTSNRWLTPIYYTYQTIPSNLQAQLSNRTYWVYSNGRWYGYTPYWSFGSDRFLAGLSGLYYILR